MSRRLMLRNESGEKGILIPGSYNENRTIAYENNVVDFVTPPQWWAHQLYSIPLVRDIEIKTGDVIGILLDSGYQRMNPSNYIAVGLCVSSDNGVYPIPTRTVANTGVMYEATASSNFTAKIFELHNQATWGKASGTEEINKAKFHIYLNGVEM